LNTLSDTKSVSGESKGGTVFIFGLALLFVDALLLFLVASPLGFSAIAPLASTYAFFPVTGFFLLVNYGKYREYESLYIALKVILTFAISFYIVQILISLPPPPLPAEKLDYYIRETQNKKIILWALFALINIIAITIRLFIRDIYKTIVKSNENRENS
jgi:hypothetical protein